MRETLITVVGNVITEPTLRRTADGKAVVNFRMASTERRVDKETGEWVDGDTFFVGVSAWKRLAESVAGSLSKGDPVVAFGRIYTRGYESEGQKRQATELVAQVVGPDLTRCTAEVRRPQARSSWTDLDGAPPAAA